MVLIIAGQQFSGGDMMDVKIVKPRRTNKCINFCIGLAILFLNKIRYSIFGYRNSGPFSINKIQMAIEYDIHVVNLWYNLLSEYVGDSATFRSKAVLELGTGADLGVALTLLTKGIRKYMALDVNNLIAGVPEQFYDDLFAEFKKSGTPETEIDILRSQLQCALDGSDSIIDYRFNKNFDISVFDGERIDFIFSQAAFEHFDDVEKTIGELSRISERGTIFIAEIDLRTHTGWIRDRDPLNIYRYSDWLYKPLMFSGAPNRTRPFEYEQYLRKHNWKNIIIKPLTIVSDNYLSGAIGSLSKKFRAIINQMNYQTIVVFATKE